MRNVVRAFASLLVVAPLLLPAVALAQERRVVVTEGADYFGADYDVVKDVDLAACQSACRDDAQCQAFTYNAAASWCFLKNAVGELRAVEGAISGRIVTAAELQPDVEAERISQLSFLAQSYVDEARRFVGRLQNTMAADPAAEVGAAQAEKANGNLVQAAEHYRTALAAAPERFDLWTEFTDAALRASSDNWEVQQRLAENRMAGAVNAFLRAVSVEDQAHALELIGLALASRYDWKPAIRAYRASLVLAENTARRDAYERLIAEHGFRIVDNVVESDAAAPRICVNFSEKLAAGRGDLADFVTVEGGRNLSVEAEGYQICVDGVQHGSRYHLTIRAGLPSDEGETLAKSVDLDLFVRDRAPSVRFATNAYVLPAGGEPTIPVVTINTTRINAELFRIGDRQIARQIADQNFLTQLGDWQVEEIEEKSGEKVWTGTVDVSSEINREITTAIPIGELEEDLQPGTYVLTAKALNETDEWAPRATQWFVVTDLGLTTLSGNDGLHVMVRSLGSAGAVGGVHLRLVAVNNEVLGEATTDASGYANFAAGLMRGTGGMAPGLLVADTSAGDYNFLDLARAPMDLTDRGVEGRDPPKPL
ncbi:MAG TPA: PAN domain-containing protein, partial [Propylenella sp.]|nr:PAN domain-containing protein [Propylenella sp.]